MAHHLRFLLPGIRGDNVGYFMDNPSLVYPGHLRMRVCLCSGAYLDYRVAIKRPQW